MQMGVRKNILWITRTAVLTALLVAAQFLTAPLGNQYVTGSAVNLLLIVSFLTCGLATGLTVAIVSPVCAFLAGVGFSFPPLIPFVALGNAALVMAWFFWGVLMKSAAPGMRHKTMYYLLAAAAAVMKFLTLYAGIVLFAIPYLLDLNEKQRVMLTLSFSYPQIITAAIGGIIALAVMPPLQKALRSFGRGV
ncbi:MAG: ECF transporter S component [Firmicutes bacterium]|nr:ECF transporter S component [Bacillota bacterium]